MPRANGRSSGRRCAACGEGGVAMDDALFAQLDRIIERRMAADNTPGLALALTDRERTLRVATYGFADLGARTPVTPDTLFEIGSIGKSFTSLALLCEHEAGNLDLQAPVARYLPWFEVRFGVPADPRPSPLEPHGRHYRRHRPDAGRRVSGVGAARDGGRHCAWHELPLLE